MNPGINVINGLYPNSQHRPWGPALRDHAAAANTCTTSLHGHYESVPPQYLPHHLLIQQVPVTLRYPNGTLYWYPNPRVPSVPSRPVTLPSQAAIARPPIYINPNLLEGQVKWDILRSPSTSRAQNSLYPFLRASSGSATHPQCQKITVNIEEPTVITLWMRQWGQLRVDARDRGGVTLGDVMNGIYAYFKEPLTFNDIACLSGHQYQQVYRAFMYRTNWARDEYYPSQRLLRIDILNGCSHFVGLRPTSFQEGHCRLSLTLRPPH